MDNRKEYESEIKDVIERNVDAYKGYAKAADKVKNPKLASTFQNQANQRKQFALELESSAHVLGDDARNKIENGTFEGNLHRTWMDIKTAFSTDKDESIVEECIRGEKEALDEYNELLDKSYISGNLNSLIVKQRETVQQCISDLRQIERVLD